MALNESIATTVFGHFDQVFLGILFGLPIVSAAMTLAWRWRGAIVALSIPFMIAGAIWLYLGWDFLVLGDRSETARYGAGAGLAMCLWIVTIWCVANLVGIAAGLFAREGGSFWD